MAASTLGLGVSSAAGMKVDFWALAIVAMGVVMLEAPTAGSGGLEGVGSGVAADLQPQRERCRGDRQEGQKSPSHDFARRSMTFYERIRHDDRADPSDIPAYLTQFA